MNENNPLRTSDQPQRDFDLLEILKNLLAHWYVILIATVLATAIGGVYFFMPVFTQDVYSSSTLIYIGNREEGDSTISTTALSISSALIGDYQQLIQSRQVTKRVCDELGLPSLAGYSISVNSISNTRFIRISVSGPYPESVALIANSIANVFSDVVVELMDIRNVSVIDEAVVPSAPSGPPRLRNTMIVGAIGFAVSVVLLIVIELANNTVKTPDDIENQFGIPVLAMIALVETDKK
ncbi:MAG: hypothetical protein IJP98_06105 [Clostridia bacterium]|nr:hypothetical protein [Clostridia bacterium]